MTCDLVTLAAPGVRRLKPYVPGKAIAELEREYGVRNVAKLASNENPLGPPPGAVEAMRRELGTLALYPDGSGHDLRAKLAARHGVEPGQVTLGNGSNDVLVLLAEAFLTPEFEAVFSQYCFAVYPLAVQATGARALQAPALAAESTQPFGHDLDALAAHIGERTRLVFIANPNNPTGTWLEADELHAFIAGVPEHALVVVDEAYHEYARALGGPDASQWLGEFPNLVVTRTFSKALGLAGIRVGYALSSPGVADILGRVRQPFNVNSLALAGATVALDEDDYVSRSVEVNATGLSQLSDGLEALGYRCPASAGNFVLADMGVPVGPIYEHLLRSGVIVRPVGNYGLPNHLRISVGTAEQNQRLLDALAEGADA